MSNPVDHLRYSSKAQLPMIEQMTQGESGITCLAMIASYFDMGVDLKQLRNEKYAKNSTLKQLTILADKFGLSSRNVKIDFEKLHHLQVPCILSWGENHFVVLKEIKGNKLVIHDPEVGVCGYTFHEISEKFNGHIIQLNPTENYNSDFSPPPPKANLSSFWSQLSGIKTTLGKIFALSILLQVFVIATPFYVQLVMDDVLVSYDYDLLTLLSIGFTLILLLQVICTALRSMMINIMGNQLSVQMSTNLIQHLFKLPMDYYEKRHIGDIMFRIKSLDKIKSLLTTTIVESLVDGLMVIGLLVVMFLYSAELALIVVSVSLVYLAIRFYLYRPYRKVQKKIIVAGGEKHTNLHESVRGIQAIKLFNRELDRLHMFNHLNVDVCNHSIKAEKLRITFASSNDLLYGLENIVVMFVAAHLVMGGAFSVGMIFAFMAYRQQFGSKASNLIDKFIEFKMISLHLERLGDITQTEKEQYLGDLDENTSLEGSLELKSVSFRYSNSDDYVLKNVNMRIEKGESVAIVGPSGCGKSTLLKIMLGLLHPDMGEVNADDKSIYQIGLKNYRNQIASVMQNEGLMSGTIIENISFFEDDPDEALVVECAIAAGIHKDILKLHDGYRSMIGDLGSSLSGGQLQRLILARALYRQPRILFLDEATSNLDITLENYINSSVKSLKMTRIFIAHRPQTILSADRIFRFHNGTFTEIAASDYDFEIGEPLKAS